MDGLFTMCAICSGERTVYPDSALPLEVWHMTDGRKLVHVDTKGRDQYWLELPPSAAVWLATQLTQEDE